MTLADDPIDLEGQKKSATERDRKVLSDARTESSDIQWLMSGKRGRRIMFQLLDRAGVYRSSFTGNSETYFREGMRNIGLIYTALIHEFASESYSTMVDENRSKQ